MQVAVVNLENMEKLAPSPPYHLGEYMIQLPASYSIMTSGYLRRLHHSLGNLFVVLHVQHDSSISTILLHDCKVKLKLSPKTNKPVDHCRRREHIPPILFRHQYPRASFAPENNADEKDHVMIITHLSPIFIFEHMLYIVGNIVLPLLLRRLHTILLPSSHLATRSKVLRRASWSNHSLNRGTRRLLTTSPHTLLDHWSCPILRTDHLASITPLAAKS